MFGACFFFFFEKILGGVAFQATRVVCACGGRRFVLSKEHLSSSKAKKYTYLFKYIYKWKEHPYTFMQALLLYLQPLIHLLYDTLCVFFRKFWNKQSLFEDLVYSGFNFFTAMPILLVGIFDKSVKQQTATECHKLYAVGRLGMDLNMRVRGGEGRRRDLGWVGGRGVFLVFFFFGVEDYVWS